MVREFPQKSLPYGSFSRKSSSRYLGVSTENNVTYKGKTKLSSYFWNRRPLLRNSVRSQASSHPQDRRRVEEVCRSWWVPTTLENTFSYTRSMVSTRLQPGNPSLLTARGRPCQGRSLPVTTQQFPQQLRSSWGSKIGRSQSWKTAKTGNFRLRCHHENKNMMSFLQNCSNNHHE